jgi:DNA-binding MarR family transcriptional regulator
MAPAPDRPAPDPAALPPPARPGNPDEEELAARLRVAVTRLHRRLRQQSPGVLSPAQSSALGSIYRLGTPTLGELAEAEQVQPPTMTRVVTSMEEAGLVTRVTDAGDRRVIRVGMTAEGRRTLQRIRRSKTAFLARRIDELDPQDHAALGELVRLLERLVAEP